MTSANWFDGRRPRLGACAGLPIVIFLAWVSLGMAQEAPRADRLPVPPPEQSAGDLPEKDASQPPADPPEEKKDDGDCEKKDGEKKKPPFWTTVPHIRAPLPKPGSPIIFPKGPGYYSLWDLLQDNHLEQAPKQPWPPISLDFFSFFEADFRYLDDPKNKQHDWLDCMKRIHPNDCWLLSFGGEERFQYKHEIANGIRLNGRDNTYQLNRTRLYADVWYRDSFRVYAEYIDAQAMNEQLRPLPIDIWKNSLLNLFTDIKLYTYDNNPVYFRGGRQELLYGSQRLISPLEWANTRRTFEGYKGYYRSEKFDLDAFWVRPVIVDPNGFGSANSNLQFTGMWGTYKPDKNRLLDVYYLFLEQNAAAFNPVPHNFLGAYSVNTLGSRYFGNYHGFLCDVEGMYQFGTITKQSLSANAATAGIGYNWADSQLNPTIWAYVDHASGDRNGGRGGTFNQLFPFGHLYLGFIDSVGRQNINDFNTQAYIWTSKWIVTGLQGHFFYLDSGKDFLYNAGGVAIRRSPRGNAGVHVGDEVDWITNFHLSNHQDILVGFSQLFAGEFIRKTGSPRSPEFFYMQYSFKW